MGNPFEKSPGQPEKPRIVKCPVCDGKGTDRDGKICKKCNGAKTIRDN